MTIKRLELLADVFFVPWMSRLKPARLEFHVRRFIKWCPRMKKDNFVFVESAPFFCLFQFSCTVVVWRAVAFAETFSNIFISWARHNRV